MPLGGGDGARWGGAARGRRLRRGEVRSPPRADSERRGQQARGVSGTWHVVPGREPWAEEGRGEGRRPRRKAATVCAGGRAPLTHLLPRLQRPLGAASLPPRPPSRAPAATSLSLPPAPRPAPRTPRSIRCRRVSGLRSGESPPPAALAARGGGGAASARRKGRGRARAPATRCARPGPRPPPGGSRVTNAAPPPRRPAAPPRPRPPLETRLRDAAPSAELERSGRFLRRSVGGKRRRSKGTWRDNSPPPPTWPPRNFPEPKGNHTQRHTPCHIHVSFTGPSTTCLE